MPFYLYVASTPYYLQQALVKIGCTEDPVERRATYLTGCPPSHDIQYQRIWETIATSRDEMCDYEDMMHNQFTKFRMMRCKPGDSEWFNFRSGDVLCVIDAFMNRQDWVRRLVSIEEILPTNRSTKFLNKCYFKNTNHVRRHDLRASLLTSVQRPVITSITEFIEGDAKAGYVIAPCGSGKTRMTVYGLKEASVNKCIICCPSNQIQLQWVEALIATSMYAKEDILMIGTKGTTELSYIRKHMQRKRYCIITTYMSSNLLVQLINTDVDVLVFDEAHHLAGVVAKEDSGEGITRRLMMKAAEMAIKRLSLTFTPRFVVNDDTQMEFLTMDDDAVFGSMIAELKLRDLINKGVLPDYRLWLLRDAKRKGSGIIGKAEFLVEAWNATEVVRSEDKHVINHLVVFTATNEDARQLEKYLKHVCDGTTIVRVQAGDDIAGALNTFAQAPRAIILNCKVLGEGVDIPVADSVAIMYPKHARGETIQMLMRAGRWCKDKPLFHILLPVTDDDDMSGFEDVLSSLAGTDEFLRDEIVLRANANFDNIENRTCIEAISNVAPECIVIEEYNGSDIDSVTRCFANVRKNIYASKDKKVQLHDVREANIKLGLKCREEYRSVRTRDIHPVYIEDPMSQFKDSWVSWYHFLGVDTSVYPQTKEDFKKQCQQKQLHTYPKYIEYVQNNQDLPVHVTEMYPNFMAWDKEFRDNSMNEVIW
jgi:superfamily II DNA or RNA helicase